MPHSQTTPTHTYAGIRAIARWHAWFAALGIGIAVFAFGYLIDWWLMPGRRELLYSDAYTGLIAALLSLVTLRYYRARQRDAIRRMQIIADANHHVRNALYTITLSVHVKNDPELTSITKSAVERIEWVLREVLPSEAEQISRELPERDRRPPL